MNWEIIAQHIIASMGRKTRVVDASVFPRISGFFIMSAIYMISEKASDVIAEDVRVADGRR